MLTRRLLPIILLVLVFNALPAMAAFDPSEYRQNTYGPPTHYVDPARALSNNGAGTLSNPWNLNQAMTLAVAGNVVGFLPGVGVRMPSTNNDNLPTFRPTNSGTPGSRIVFVTRYAAVALPNVATNPNRTELRHDGTPAVATGASESGTGSAMYGVNGRSYITFDGFFVDMAQAEPKSDGGVIRVENATGVHFRNFEIKGTTTNMGTNPIMYRPENARDTVLSNFRAYDFINDTSGSNTPQGALFSDQYGDQNFLIEHFEISNTERGIFLKGTAPAGVNYNYGTIRYGIVSNVNSCYAFNDLDPTNLTTLEYCLCYDVTSGAGIRLSVAGTSVSRNLLIHHNTVARINSAPINTIGGFYTKVPGFGSNVTIRDNLIDITAGPHGHGFDASEVTTLPSTMNYNGYTKNGSTVTWTFNGVQYSTIANWRAATGREANSQVLSSTPFVGRANANFRVTTGHPAKTASSTGGEIGAYAGGQIVGVDVGGGTTPQAPVAPTALTITR